MIDLSQCTALGRITKTSGIRGRVILQLYPIGFESILRMEWVFIEIDNLPVPFFVNSYQSRSDNEMIIGVDGIDNETRARELVRGNLWIPSEDLDNIAAIDPAHTQSLIGYEIIDLKHGKLGPLKDILDFRQNPLLRVIKNKTEILIPLQPEFIAKIDHKTKTIRVNTPDGLLDQ